MGGVNPSRAPRLLRQFLHRTPPGDCFSLRDKYFSNKIVKSLRKKEKKRKLLVRKKTVHAEKTKALLTSSLRILLLFKNFFIPLLSASHDTLKARVFRNNAIPLRVYLLWKNMSHLREFDFDDSKYRNLREQK